MTKRWLEHLLSLGIGLVALGIAVGAAFFLVALVSGEPLQTTLPLALSGAVHGPVTAADKFCRPIAQSITLITGFF